MARAVGHPECILGLYTGPPFPQPPRPNPYPVQQWEDWAPLLCLDSPGLIHIFLTGVLTRSTCPQKGAWHVTKLCPLSKVTQHQLCLL